jgi:hypothetical protein
MSVMAMLRQQRPGSGFVFGTMRQGPSDAVVAANQRGCSIYTVPVTNPFGQCLSPSRKNIGHRDCLTGAGAALLREQAPIIIVPGALPKALVDLR